jgi:hypothetical protein
MTTKVIAIKTGVKAGVGFGGGNHNQGGIAVRSTVKAGGLIGQNHNQNGIAVQSKASYCANNWRSF